MAASGSIWLCWRCEAFSGSAVAGDGLRAARDRAFLAIGMAGAYRRSEQVALRVEDIARDDRGLRIEPPPMATTRDRE
jgi:integrase